MKDLREKYGLTQAKLSELTGVPLRSIQNWECGHRNPPDYVLELIRFKIEKMLDEE